MNDDFHFASKPPLNLERKITGATIGYNVAVANNNLRYNLSETTMKKKKTNK